MEQQTVHLFVFNTLSDWEPAYVIAAINGFSSWQVHPGRYQVKTVGESREPVKTIGGVTILPDMTLDELEPSQSALLILPGGDGWEGEHGKALKKAQAFLAADVPVAAICGATVGLALAGILDEKHHTGNSPDQLKATGYRGTKLYQDQIAISDGNLITASGTAPLEFAYQILQKLEVYTPQMLDAWYGLYKTSDPSYFFTLAKAATSNV